MAVRIRLTRVGAKGKPFYRIVAADSRYPRDGRYLELLGTYDPRQSPPTVVLKQDRIRHWLETGARPSETVRRFLKKMPNEIAAEPEAAAAAG